MNHDGTILPIFSDSSLPNHRWRRCRRASLIVETVALSLAMARLNPLRVAQNMWHNTRLPKNERFHAVSSATTLRSRFAVSPALACLAPTDVDARCGGRHIHAMPPLHGHARPRCTILVYKRIEVAAKCKLKYTTKMKTPPSRYTRLTPWDNDRRRKGASVRYIPSYIPNYAILWSCCMMLKKFGSK